MTVGHLLFAAVTTAYISVGIALEERDRVDVFGDEYRRYKTRVSIIPPWSTAGGPAGAGTADSTSRQTDGSHRSPDDREPALRRLPARSACSDDVSLPATA